MNCTASDSFFHLILILTFNFKNLTECKRALKQKWGNKEVVKCLT